MELTEDDKTKTADLIQEFRDIVQAIPKTMNRPMNERIAVRNRLSEIKKELQTIQEKYNACSTQ